MGSLLRSDLKEELEDGCARLLGRPGHFLALGFQQFVEIMNEPGSPSGLVGQMTVRGRLGRADGSTFHSMLHLGVLQD